FGVELSFVEVFERPTAAAVAGLVDGRARRRPARRGLPPVIRAPRSGPLPLSFSQEPVWFLLQLEPGNLAYNAQFSVRFTGNLDVHALRRALTEIVRRHEIFRTTFPALHGQPMQQIHEPFEVELPLVDLIGPPVDVLETDSDR